MEEKTGHYFKSENDTQSYYFINEVKIINKENVTYDKRTGLCHVKSNSQNNLK